MASCTVSSARSRCAGPNSRVKYATIRPASRRNRCSSSVCSSALETALTARLSAPHVADFHSAAVIEGRMIQRQLHRLVVAGRFDGVVTAQHFLGLAVGTVGGSRLAALGTPEH